ncbi:vWA domain-containing protein [Pseudoalteromonas xiamenensis]
MKSEMLVDVYFLMDATGSMQNAIDGVKTEIKSYVSSYCKCNPRVNLAYGLGIYRDTGDSQPFDLVQTINTDVSSLVHNLARVTASGGGDTLEGQVIPLSVLNYGAARWRPGALRIVAWYGDHGAHETRVYEGRTYNKETAVNNLLETNTIVIALSVGNNCLNERGIAQFITSSTSGRYVENVHYDKLCSTLFEEISERFNLVSIPAELLV